MSPRLTIGMAHFEDYDGVYFTIQSIRAHHSPNEVEFLVVDNSPKSPHGKDVAGLLAHMDGRYIPLPDAVGTSVPRDTVFREASAPAVLCMDCHVLLPRMGSDSIGSVRNLIDYWESNATSRDMVTGPLINDRLGMYATHFNDQWRAEMWGTWGMAWSCPCGSLHFSPVDVGDNRLQYVELVTQFGVDTCCACQYDLPALDWAGHERKLIDAGCKCIAAERDAKPFEIPGMGLGLFSMRKDAWVGFNPDARGFGGEELYVHEKVRRAGGKVLNLPWLTWLHRFGRPGGAKYPISRETKVRNYVLEFNELGMDLEPIHTHFVKSGLVADGDWQALIADPVGFNQRPQSKRQPCGSNRNQPAQADHNLDTVFDWCVSQPRDLEKHAAKIRELASQVSHVTAMVKRREWDVFLLAGRPDDVITYTTERDTLHDTLHGVVMRTETNPRAVRRIKHYTVHKTDSKQVTEIVPTDMLVIDTVHHADRLTSELTKFAGSVRRWIVIRGTQAFGEIAEGGQGPGLLPALRRFMREHTEWSVVYHSVEQYGLTVIGCLPSDKPKPPGLVTLAANFAKAMADHVADGLAKVSSIQLEHRLSTCSLCEQRKDTRCTVCGCYVDPKASMRSSVCPLGKWSEISE